MRIHIDTDKYLAGSFLISRMIQHMSEEQRVSLLLDLRNDAGGLNPGSGAQQAGLAAAMLETQMDRLDEARQRFGR